MSQAPPAYGAASVTDDVSDLIVKALHIQDSLSKARLPISQIDEVVGSTFSAPLMVIDDKFVDLVADSKTSAATLVATIEYFVNAVVPIAKDSSVPLSSRYETVQDSAEQISQAANEYYPTIKNNVDEVKASLVSLHRQISEIKEKHIVASVAELAWWNNEVSVIALKIKGHPKVYAKLSDASKNFLDGVQRPVAGTSKPSGKVGGVPEQKQATIIDVLIIVGAVEMIITFFNRDAEAEANRKILDAKVEELGLLQDKLEKKNAQLREAATKASDLISLVSKIVDNIGNFGAIWSKLVSDSEELKAFLNSSGTNTDETAFIERVEAELPIYSNIKGVLEDYCLQV